MKKLLFIIMFVLLSFQLSFADRIPVPSGSIRWDNFRDNYFNVQTEELYNFLGADESGELPETPTFDSLIISGSGNSWIELENNTSFTDSLTGKYGMRFYNGVLQQIINGTASALGSGVVDDTAYGVSWDDVTDEAPSKNAVYDKISTISAAGAPTVQAADPTIADTTGWYLATTSGDAFYVIHGVGVFTIAGSYTGDETDPVVGTVTPSALTHDGTGATLSATVASVTEINEEDREWSLYDVTDAAVEIDWSVFTGLSIATISIPADQHTYRVDVRCTDLAGNVGSASSANIVYGAVEETYGSISTGTSGRFQGGDGTAYWFGRPVTISAGTTLTEIGGFFSSSSGSSRTCKLALYTNNSGVPGTQVTAEAEITIPANATNEEISVAYTGTVSAGEYWIGYVPSYSEAGCTYTNGVGTRTRHGVPATYDLPASGSASNSTTTITLALFVKVQ